jgi:hypothetical protein
MTESPPPSHAHMGRFTTNMKHGSYIQVSLQDIISRVPHAIHDIPL